jgi:MFS family permease
MSYRPIGRQEKEATALLSIGTFLEYFDLLLFVHMAIVLDNLFFPETWKNNPYFIALTFCSTYFFRPLGALFFGWVGDNIGRKATVIITTMTMAISCLFMAAMPTYAQIGITAAWLVTGCRIIQGITSMGERIGAEIYLMESPLNRFRFPIVALIAAFSTLGGVAALGFANILMSYGEKYGISWRYAFVGGAVVAFIGIGARIRLRETADFVNFKKLQKQTLENNNATKEEKEKIFNYPIFNYKLPVFHRTKVAFFLIQCAHPLCFYFIYGYCANILKMKFGCSPADIIHNNFIVSLFELTKMLIIMPILSYYIYPLKILKVKLALFFFGFLGASYFLTTATTPNDIFLIQATFSLIAIGSGPAIPIFYSYFPTGERSTAAATIYAIARALTYAITTFGAALLTEHFGYLGLLLLFLPIFSGYLFGLNHFSKLEKDIGLYPDSWFNLHITYPNDDDDDDDDDDNDDDDNDDDDNDDDKK